MLSKRFSLLIRLFGIISFSYLSVSCGNGDGPSQVIDAAALTEEQFILVWSDEFDQDGAPNVKNWRIETGYGPDNNGWGNDEWQLYTDSSDNVRVENGNLVISANCSTAPNCGDGATSARNGTITSARINTNDKVEIKYGKIKARIKTPPGKGTWPAFWMLGANFPDQEWPGAGEIDIMEMHQFYSDNKTTHFTVHWCEDSVSSNPCVYDPGWRFFSEFKTFDEVLTDDYHIFELDWDEDRIVGKIDDITYYTKSIDPQTNDELQNSFFLILNIAIGGTLGGPPAATVSWPQEMLVDWVRVYEKQKPEILDLIAEDVDSGSLAYAEIINSVIFGGDSVEADLINKDVTPVVGNYVLELDYTSANTFFSGGAFSFNRADLSDYSKLVFSINTTGFPEFSDISVELVDNRNTGGSTGKVSVLLSNYTPAISGDWASYEIPLSDFTGVDLTNVVLFGFWNPVNSTDQLIAGTLYLDNILFVNEPCEANGVVNFDTDSYADNTVSTSISLTDTCLANKTVVVLVDNGTDTIGVGVTVDASGYGAATVNFGPTNDATSTIAISDGDLLTLAYTDTQDTLVSDTADITSGDMLGVYSETNTDPVIAYSEIINVLRLGGKDTVTNETSTAVVALEGSVVLAADYTSIGAGGNYNGFVFNFGPPNSGGSANLLLNGGFSSPDATAGDVQGHTDWTWFNQTYTTANDGPTSAPVSHNPEDNQSVKQFGFDGGALQDVAVVVGETYQASMWVMNWTGNGTTDPFGEFAFMEFSFRDGGGGLIAGSDSQAFVDPVDDGTNIYLSPQDGAEVGDWTQLTLSAVAPAGAVSGRMLMIHQLVGGSGGTVRWDDASIYEAAAPVVPGNISTYAVLTFGINTTDAGALIDLEVRMVDSAGVEVSAFLSDYPPALPTDPDGWDVYQIPLTAFAGLDLGNISYFGFWNASSDVSPTVTLFDGTVYFDDIHFTK